MGTFSLDEDYSVEYSSYDVDKARRQGFNKGVEYFANNDISNGNKRILFRDLKEAQNRSSEVLTLAFSVNYKEGPKTFHLDLNPVMYKEGEKIFYTAYFYLNYTKTNYLIIWS